MHWRGIEHRVIIADQQRVYRRQRQRLLHQGQEFPVDDHDFRHGMVKLEGDDRRIQPCIDRMQDRAAHRHAVMAFQHGWRVGQQNRHGIAAPCSLRRKGTGQLP